MTSLRVRKLTRTRRGAEEAVGPHRPLLLEGMGAAEHQRQLGTVLECVPQGVQKSCPPTGVQGALQVFVFVQAEQCPHLLRHHPLDGV